MKKKLICFFLAAVISLSLCSIVEAANKTPAKIGLRGGLGTDISGGLAYGAGANYQLDLDGSVVELGINLYSGGYREEMDNGFHTYTETTKLFVFGVIANYLINYTPDDPGMFFVAGAGFALVNVNWEEESETDIFFEK